MPVIPKKVCRLEPVIVKKQPDLRIMIIGIDVGGSTTKIVGVKDGEIRNPMFVTAKDPVTSLFGAFGKYIYDHSIQLSEVEQVMLPE